MGLLSFGGGTSRTSSSSQGSSLDVSRSGSVGGGFSTSFGSSGQDIAFNDIFANLFGGASNVAGGIDTSTLTGQANQLFGAGGGFLDSLQGGPSQEYLEGRVSGESPVLQEQIDALGVDIGKFFSEQINPEITSTAVAGGTLGGGRQGVAQGLAAEAAGKEFQRGALGLRSADIQARDSAAGVLGGQRIAGAQTGLGALPGLAGIAEFASTSGLTPYAALADILGGPTVLSESESGSEAADFATSFANSFGTSQSSSTSTSRSKDISITGPFGK